MRSKAAVLAAVLLTASIQTQIFAQEVPPAVPAEIPARTCYLDAESYWQSVVQATPADTAAFRTAYRRFAHCAALSISTGEYNRHLKERMPWSAEYFASTVGAAYAQSKLVDLDPRHRCDHVVLAAALVEQAEETLSEQTGPYDDTDFAKMLGDLHRVLRDQAGACK